jgi:D-alanyl-D-alanine carboxypeptidase
MTSTGVLAAGEVTGYSNVDGVFVESVHKHPSIGGAAGAMKSTASDLLRFIIAIADGSLLSPQSQQAMLSMVPGDDLSQFGIVHHYGLGLEQYSNSTITVVGHMGSGNVNSSFIGYDPTSGTAVAVMMNTDTPGPQAFMAIETLTAARTS